MQVAAFVLLAQASLGLGGEGGLLLSDISGGSRDESKLLVRELRAAVSAALPGDEGALRPLVWVARACVELLPVSGASISIMAGVAHRETLYASDAVIERIEALQFSLGEGPSFEAFHTGRPVLVPDLAEAVGRSWPVFATQIAAESVGAIFAFPLAQGAARVGAIDMYRCEPGWLRPDEIATAMQVAAIATTAVLGSHALGGPGLADWIRALPSRRETVHQATGMLIAAHHISAEHALARLRGYAFAAGRLLDDVAVDLVKRRLSADDIDV